MVAIGWRRDLAKDFVSFYDGQWPSSKTNFAPAPGRYPPFAGRNTWGHAIAYQWPRVTKTGMRREAEAASVVYGQLVVWLQRMIITLAELMPQLQVDLLQVLHAGVREVLEA